MRGIYFQIGLVTLLTVYVKQAAFKHYDYEMEGKSLSSESQPQEENYSDKVEVLLTMLRKHQQNEERLKTEIRSLLTKLHSRNSQAFGISHSPKVRSKYASVKDIISMLNLSANQSELIENIVKMMEGYSSENNNFENSLQNFKDDSFYKVDNENVKLTRSQVESLAKDVAKIIKQNSEENEIMDRSTSSYQSVNENL